MAITRVESERISIEKYWSIHTECSISVPTELLMLTAVGLGVGSIMALIKSDWRWIIVAMVLGFLMWLGLALRWLIYDRWLKKVLADV